MFILYNLRTITFRSRDNNHDLINWNLKLTRNFGNKIFSKSGYNKEKKHLLSISNYENNKSYSTSLNH
jgi:hypothetical protein